MRFVSAFSLVCVSACASGDGGSRDEADEGEDVAEESSSVTNDTIDPTNFSTTGPGESEGPGTSGTDGPAETTLAESTGTATGGDAPTVVEVTPTGTGVDPTTSIAVTFSAAMDPASVTVDESGDCTGAIQVSDDDFASCVAMEGPATASDGDAVFELRPADSLASTGEYAVRVTADATSARGVPAQPFESRTPFTIRYFHTIDVDGVDDWGGGETFSTSTDGHLAFTAWDDEFVYLGMQSPDVATPNDEVWVVVYVGGTGGTTTGQQYATQQPTLPFEARWHVRWRADNTYTDVQEYDGDAWVTAPWQLAEGDVYQSGQLLELRIARADIGEPDTLELHMGILRETALAEASWAAHPEGSYVDGYDPEYTQFWAFDLLGSVPPIEQPPMP